MVDRPSSLAEVIGQKRVVTQLRIAVISANKRDDAVPHILFEGPPGLGKTTLASLVAKELNSDCFTVNGGNIKSVKQILPYIFSLKHKDVLFIDEIHRLPITIEEFLYSVMEDFRADIGGEEMVHLTIPKFTLIGATTLSGKISKPMYDRFVLKLVLEKYLPSDMVNIIKHYANKLSLKISEDDAQSLIEVCRGTPRQAVSFLLRARDYCSVINTQYLNKDIINKILELMDIKNGLTKQERDYIKVLESASGPVSLKTLANTLNISTSTLENFIEPFLLEKRIILKTPSGRILAGKTYQKTY